MLEIQRLFGCHWICDGAGKDISSAISTRFMASSDSTAISPTFCAQSTTLRCFWVSWELGADRGLKRPRSGAIAPAEMPARPSPANGGSRPIRVTPPPPGNDPGIVTMAKHHGDIIALIAMPLWTGSLWLTKGMDHPSPPSSLAPKGRGRATTAPKGWWTTACPRA